MRNEVNAKILGIPFPFLGVDNTSACGAVYLADGITKANCPLKAGEEYIYKNQFNILEIYPKASSSRRQTLNVVQRLVRQRDRDVLLFQVKVGVHWALVTQDNDRVLCFDVPAKIVS